MKITLRLLNGTLIPYSKEDRKKIDSFDDGIYEIDIKNMDVRTLQQNKALHKYFSILASVLNSAGLEISKVIKVDTPWSAHSIKELLWKPVQEQQLNKKSTTRLTKDEVTQECTTH